MQQIKSTNIHIGSEEDFKQNFIIKNKKNDLAIVNVAGNLHRLILGYRPKKDDPSYVLHISPDKQILSANFVDASDPKYYDWNNNGVSVFTKILDFIDLHIQKSVLINCNQGISRSPSIALLYLAKRAMVISKESFQSAHQDFTHIYLFYQPQKGIELFLRQNWSLLQ